MKLPLSLALAALVGAGPAFADPPKHAPAHGYYKKQQANDRNKPKHARHYQGKSGVSYVNDYGISAGRCNRDEIGTVIGGVTGAVIGGQIAGRDDRVVGMVVGGVLGAIVGHAIGDRMDERDRACMGHALEIGRPGVPVEWRSAGHAYQFTPRGDARDGCRNATLVVDGRKPREVLACPSGRGEWRFRNI
ncbi:MAG: hypothetical protein CVU23_09590 [Betaproteobacteria bacterium HGW-Betaproteobacteria-17]|nr:MAG: hypothetical protein CVU23_09590 [Betaproteobacteria bacterium HGW-Betaproteobacteria-17]